MADLFWNEFRMQKRGLEMILWYYILFSLFLSGLSKKKEGQVIKRDLPYISCQVCEKTVAGELRFVQSAHNWNKHDLLQLCIR
jgi:hypothetical protein